MKKIIPFIILGIVVIFGGIRLLSKPKVPAVRNPSSRSSSTAGRTTGQIKSKSAEEIAAEKKKIKAEERARKRELRRRQREEKRAQRLASRYGYGYTRSRSRLRSRRGVTSSARGRRSGAGYYQLRGIISIDNVNYALIDNQQYRKGDVVMGRKIDDVQSDRILINDAGKSREVKIGEACFPNLLNQTKRIRR